MNAETRPAIATCFSRIVSAAFLTQTVTPPTATTPAAAEVPPSMKPSGMCTLDLLDRLEPPARDRRGCSPRGAGPDDARRGCRLHGSRAHRPRDGRRRG